MIDLNELECLEGEVWAFHNESGLAVSNLGRVFIPPHINNIGRNYKCRYTYGSNDKNGYKKIFWKNKQPLVHRLVAECFLENLDNLPTVDHINRNPSDNRVENLRWADMKLQRFNQNNINRKNNTKSKQVAQINPNTNEVIRIWESTRECERNGFHSGHISDCCLGKQNTHKGFKWQYA